MAHGSPSPLAGPRLHYITAVWGDAFTRRFVDAVMPTHASAGNLEALSDRPGDIYRIFTTADDAATIRASAIFRHIAKLVDTRVEDVEPWLAQGLDKYGVIGGVHQWALEEAVRGRAAAVFLAPDAVFADGAFARLRDLTLRGVRKVMVAGLRAQAEPWLAAVRGTQPQTPGQPWAVPSRLAIASAIRHPHPLTQALRWDAPRMHASPSHLYFSDPEAEEPAGWICRAFHLHPMLVWPREIHGVLRTTVDGDLDRVAPLHPDETHIVTDSDELAAVELSDGAALEVDPTLPRDGRSARVAQWANTSAQPEQWDFFGRSIVLRARDADDRRWSKVEREAQRVAESIVKHRAAQRVLPTPNAAAAPNASEATARLHFIVPVWGELYIQRFLRWGLPSFLAAGNLPAVAARTHGFDIVTDHADLPLYDHPAIERLKALVNVRFRTPGDDLHRHGVPDDSLGYTKMTRYYNAAVTAQDDPAVAHVFLTPEGVFSDGMFPAILARLDAGYRAVALPGFRVLEETAIDNLLAEHLDSTGLALSATPRELVRWVLDHPHPISVAHVWGDAWGPAGPRLHPHYYWPVGDAGFVAHCFHVHPLCAWPTTPGYRIPPGQTLDHEYLQEAVPLNRVHLVTDTDEMCVIDIAQAGHLGDTFGTRPFSAEDVADFAALWTNGFHRAFFERGIRVHAKPITDDWRPVESQARATVAEVLARLSRSVEMPVYAQSRAAQVLQAQLAAQQAMRPRWMRVGLKIERKQAALRRRAAEVGWWKVFAVRTRTRRVARRVVERFRLPPEDRV